MFPESNQSLLIIQYITGIGSLAVAILILVFDANTRFRMRRLIPTERRNGSKPPTRRYRILWILLTLFGFTYIISSAISGLEKQEQVITDDFVTTTTLKTDPHFSPSHLPDEAQIWHDRLIRAIDDKVYPDYTTATDLYGFGRNTGMYIYDMAFAAYATKNPRFVYEISDALDFLQSKLSDAWPECRMAADGILNFIWAHDTTSSLYCTDDHVMDDLLTASGIAYGAFALQQNTYLNPGYSDKVNFWIDYLENNFLRKYLIRGNTSDYSDILNRYLTHPYQSSVNLFYYLYRLTGKTDYLTEAKRRAQVMDATFWRDSVNGYPVVVWRHRPADHNIEEEDCQPTNYSNYTVVYAIALSLDNFSIYNNSLMTGIANTVNQLVLTNSSPQIGLSDSLCGTHSFATDRGYNITSPGTSGERRFEQITYYAGLIAATIWQPEPSFQEKLYLAYLYTENKTESQLDNGADLLYFSYPTAMLLKYSGLISTPTPN